MNTVLRLSPDPDLEIGHADYGLMDRLDLGLPDPRAVQVCTSALPRDEALAKEWRVDDAEHWLATDQER